jgi:hypothetical protein
VFGYPAGRNIAEMLCPRVRKDLALKSRGALISVVRVACWWDEMRLGGLRRCVPSWLGHRYCAQQWYRIYVQFRPFLRPLNYSLSFCVTQQFDDD